MKRIVWMIVLGLVGGVIGVYWGWEHLFAFQAGVLLTSFVELIILHKE